MTITDEGIDSTAQVFADVLDFPIYVSHLDDTTRILFGPWRGWDFATALIGVGLTCAGIYFGFESGYAAWIAVFGVAATAGLTYLARQIPISRPSPWYRMWWLLNCAIGTQRRAATRGQRDPWVSPPKAVIDNLVFTRAGVYAEFILAGQPGGMMPYEVKRAVAKAHRPLVRQLPSGMVFWGMSPRVDPMRMKQRLLGEFSHHDTWVREARQWDQYFDQTAFYEQVFGVRIPVDAGMAGRSGAGAMAKATRVVIGRDHDAPETLDGYRAIVEEILAKIPEQFHAKPATARQIQWLYERHWTRGAQDRPFPHGGGGQRRLGPEDFTCIPAEFDEGDQHRRKQLRSWPRRHLPTWKAILRIKAAGLADSYQACLVVSQLPRGGLAYPRAEILLSPYDVDVNAQVDWYQHVCTRTREQELARVDRAQRNMEDQAFHLSGRRASNADLARRFAAAERYSAALNESQLERATESTTVIAIGSTSSADTAHAVQQLKTHFAEELDTAIACRRGTQTALWQLGHPGSEARAPRSQFKQPTTTDQWSRFSPLVSAELGHKTGILLARNLATRLPSPVFVDLEGSVDRRVAPGMLFIGASGGGKSEAAKRITDGLLKRGHQASIIDSGTMREWVPALAHHGDRIAVIDPAGAEWSMDGLRIFPRDTAVEHTLDHLLPMMGQEANSTVARQMRRLLRPDQRVAETLGALVRYLNGLGRQDYAEYAELADTLTYWSEMDYLRAMFDESLPVPPIAEKDAIIWLTADLELPDIAETDELHLYKRQTARARAGLAIYGMIASLTRLTYTDPVRRRANAFGWFVAEEARTYFASPVGRKDAKRIATQGRKEHYGLIGISQHVEDFDAIGRQELPMRVITPFKPTEREYARESFKKLGIDPAEYPEVLDTRTVDGHGYAYFLDDLGRAGLVDLLHPVQPELAQAFDTRYLNDRASGQAA
ncbi:ATP-binding protein [Mycobacterium riyadhense]|uniref:ATP-binding protein n=1 Tax=Mycobacterium riyadhense TaxID=486698 RepID=UPI001EF9FE3F|nr:ATP-binding protein [Mycobacterium riyadhense]